MRVYLMAEEADAEVANRLADFLSKRAMMVRLAIGKDLMMPAHHGEMTVALWSLKTRMSARQIFFTNRAIDALVNDTLVVGQLDHHPLPYGLADIQPIDLRSPHMRLIQFQNIHAALQALQAKARRSAEPPAAAAPGGGGEGEEDTVEELEASVPEPSHAAFISYASSNRDQVMPIVASVEAGGIDLWFDRDGLKPGTNWAGTIVRAIKSSERFCLMCSAQSFASDHVRRGGLSG